MKRWLPLAVLLLVAGLALGFGGRSSGSQTPAQRADGIASRVKCPTCQGLSVSQSKTGISIAIHEEIDRQVALGRTDAEVIEYISQKYGDGLLINPPATGAGAVVWVAPIAFLIVSFVAMGLAFRRWKSASGRTVDDADLSAVERARRASRRAVGEVSANEH
jgi:cytochrome c-type biogenesis protein CcmH